jgi:hypothetical protein
MGLYINASFSTDPVLLQHSMQDNTIAEISNKRYKADRQKCESEGGFPQMRINRNNNRNVNQDAKVCDLC